MTVAWYRFRHTLRRRWIGYLAVALLIAVLGGVSLASIAGARRTSSALHRFMVASNPSDMATVIGPYDQEFIDAIARFPQVVGVRTWVGFLVAPLDAKGAPILDATVEDGEWVGSVDGFYFDQDRFTVTHGRMADPTKADEIVISELRAQRSGYRLGRRIEVGVFDQTEIEDAGDNAAGVEAKDRLTVKVVGIGLFTDEVVQDEVDRIPRVLSTPAFTKRAMRWSTYTWTGLRLKRGASDVTAVKKAYLDLLDAGPGTPHTFRVTSDTEAQGQRAIQPSAVALAAFGSLALLATLVLAGQAMARQLHRERDDLDQLRAMGMSPSATATQGLFGAGMVIVAGTLLALAVAAALSPLGPIGSVRRVEVSPGISLDWAVLGIGAALLLTVLAVVTRVVAWRQVPHRVARRPPARSAPRSMLATVAKTIGLPVAAVTGIRHATAGEGGPSAANRSVITGAVVAIVAVVASLTFGAGLDTLVSHPRLYGWNWDEMLFASAGYGDLPRGPTDSVLGADPDIAEWSGVYFGSLELDGRNVVAIGAESHTVAPPLLSGHGLEGPNDVVLGAVTLGRLHKKLGDTVTLAGERGPVMLRVVGTATFPTIGVTHGSHTSMGSGAFLDYTLVPGTRNPEQRTPQGANAVLVRFRPGTDHAMNHAHLVAHAAKLSNSYNSVAIVGVQRPAEIMNDQDMRSTPALLGGGLLGAVIVSLALALAAGVRRRQGELAILGALGFTRRQLAATVIWQSAVTVALGVLIGVPVGIVLGRSLWTLFAEQLHAVAQPTVPIVVLAVGAVGVMVVSVLVAVMPGRAASRVAVNKLLRSQ